MLERFRNFILLRGLRLRRLERRLTSCLGTELAESFLEVLLKLMRLVFLADPAFRRNIEGFRGRYVLASADGGLALTASFADGRMKVRRGKLPDPNLTITFRDERALFGLLSSPRPDILNALLHQDVVTEGNLNYLYKLAYMATSLVRRVTGAAV